MKAVTIKELKDELVNYSPKELRELCLRLARFKKENKELMTYLMFEASDESSYIENIKHEVDEQLAQINKKSPYLIKKSFRKIVRTIRKYSHYSLKKETEVELMIFFCAKIKKFTPSVTSNSGLHKFYLRQVDIIRKKIPLLHEDLQFDFGTELSDLVLL